MAGVSVEIRSATPEEMAQVLSSLAAAFLTDPLARLAYPRPHAYFSAMPPFFGEFGGQSFTQGTAYVSEDLCGAALWLPPGVHPDGDASRDS